MEKYASSNYKFPEEHAPVVDVTFPGSVDRDTDFEAWLEMRENNPVDEKFIQSMNEFSYETAYLLLQEAESPNFNYSPASLYYALAVAASGAEGETQRELLELLGTDDIAYLQTQCRNLFLNSYVKEETYSMTIANSLWIDDSLKIKKRFAQDTADNFFATCHYGDFSDPELAERMSDWVWDNTGSSLRPKFEMSPNQIFSIINCVYFASEWTDEFYEEHNTREDFFLSDGTTREVEYMHSGQQGEFYRGENFTRAGRNLKKGSMFFVLPHEGVSVSELYKDEAALTEACSGGQYYFGDVTWVMPKFSFNTDIKLTEPLKALGVNTMFSDEADFSGISNSSLFVSNVAQGTKIAIDEKGVEAAAFTNIDYCGSALTEERADMILNRPFLYGITDDCGNILFIGVCGDPNLQE